MKKVLLLGVSIVFLISALFIGATAAASANGSQNWFLDSASHDAVPGCLVMEKTGVQDGNAAIPNNGYLVWAADEAALADVTFPVATEANPWVVYLSTTNWASTCTAQIGQVDSLGQFTPFNNQVQGTSTYLGGGILKVPMQTESETIPVGNYLALKIVNNGAGNRQIVTIGASTLTSPEVDPGYPLPEIAAGILLGAGLIGLVSFIVIRRKKATAR